MHRRLFLLLFFIISGCGYTTSGCMYSGKKIIVKPVVNKMKITSENREYANFETFPILIENKLTNMLVRKFNSDGNLKVVSQGSDALQLNCTVSNYTKESLSYENGNDVEEQRLRLVTHIIFTDAKGEVLQDKSIQGETTYYLTGTGATSEIAARDALIDDTAKRIVESITEEW
ncbi:MAG: LPS assembly lipoprotein LptE [Candidatus Omnitrophota bacterium]